jgi:hypothetical protein
MKEKSLYSLLALVGGIVLGFALLALAAAVYH